MLRTGPGAYYDGQTSRRQDVRIELEGELRLLGSDGRRIAVWPLDELREGASLPGVLRITREGGLPLARLDVRDKALAEAIRADAPELGARAKSETGIERKVVFWSLAAVVSLVVFGFFGIPALAGQLAPLLPWSFDRQMGRSADAQIRFILPTRKGGFSCGTAGAERPGRLALDALAKRLSDAAELPVPIEITVVRSDIPNALALPGGVIYLFDGLIQKAENGDEIAGVLSHEIGHVAHRDGTKRVLQAGGSAFLFGYLLGDFVGGGAAVIIARALSEASYSRLAESEADAYAVALMGQLKADPRGLGTLLERMTRDDSGDSDDTFDYLSSHPATADRKRAVDAAAGPGPNEPLMSRTDFEALKKVCSEPGP